MTEDTRLNSDAVAWIQTLQARGVRLRARGKQLAMLPKQAFGLMSAEERQTLKQHKAAIIALVQEGRYAPTTPQPETKAPSAPCKFCYRSPCIGEQHELFDLLHPLSERQVYERNMAHTKKFLEEIQLRLRYGLPSPEWDTPSPDGHAAHVADLLQRRQRDE